MIENKLTFLKNLNLLLVDDEEELLQSLTITLSFFFKEIITAKNGEDALDIFKHNSINVIITDYVLPKISGDKFCSEIRRLNKKIPIVMMSNYSEKDKLLNVISLNLTEYIIKPVTYAKLIETLVNVVIKLNDEEILIEKITPTVQYNTVTKELVNDGEKISLSNSEIKVIELFIKNKNKILTNDNISDTINNYDNKSIQAIKNIIHRIRKKIGKEKIINIQSLGYMLVSNSGIDLND